MAGAPRGNKNAAKGRAWATAIEREIARLEGGDLAKGLQRLARRMVGAADKAEGPELQALLREIGDRIDGKPAQAVEISGSLTHELTDTELDSQLATLSQAGIVGAGAGEGTTH